jgi:hypothetical protein
VLRTGVERDAVPIVKETGWAPGPIWTGAENLAPTGIRSPDRQSRSESLYRLANMATHWIGVLFLVPGVQIPTILCQVCLVLLSPDRRLAETRLEINRR